MATRFWVGNGGTWDNTATTNWSATDNGANGASAPVAGDTVTINANSGTGTITTFAGTIACTSITCGAMNMTLDCLTNNTNFTISDSVSITGAGTRTINMGNGTWTFTTAGGVNVWNATTVTNLSFSADSSTILFSGTATSNRALIGGGLSYNNFTVSNASANGRAITITGSNSFVNITLTNVRYFSLSAAATTTITGAFVYDGTSSAPGMLITSTGQTSTINVSGANTLNWLSIVGITKAGAGSIAAIDSYDLGTNANITFTPPAVGTGGNKWYGG